MEKQTKRLLPLGILAMAPCCFGAWTQSQFTIASWWDPPVTGNETTDRTEFQKLRDCGFNLMLGDGPGFDHTFTGANGIPYRLRIASLVSGLKMMVTDNRYYLAATAYNQAAIDASISDYQGLTTAQRNAIYGYLVADEPAPEQLAVNMQKLDRISVLDQNRPAFINLYSISYWPFSASCGTKPVSFDYNSDYVDIYAGNANTKIIGFDFYPYIWDGGRFAMKDRFYRNNQIVATAAAKRKLPYWAFPMVTEGVWQQPGSVVTTMERYPNPIYCDPGTFSACAAVRAYDGAVDFRVGMAGTNGAAAMRVLAFAPLLYGAKGVVWYTYAPPGAVSCATAARTFSHSNSPMNNNVLYTRVRDINSTLANMGPAIMDANWVATVHGSGSNNEVGAFGASTSETGLPTLSETTPLLATTTSLPGQCAVGIFAGEKSKYHYIMVLNKSRTASNSVTLRFKNTIRAAWTHQKTANGWTSSSNSGTSTTWATTLNNIPPGDIQMVRVQASSVRKYMKAISPD